MYHGKGCILSPGLYIQPSSESLPIGFRREFRKYVDRSDLGSSVNCDALHFHGRASPSWSRKEVRRLLITATAKSTRARASSDDK